MERGRARGHADRWLAERSNATRQLQQVGNRALPSLIAVLQHDAPYDPEIAKAVLETLMQLMEVGEKVRLGGLLRCNRKVQAHAANPLRQPAKDDPGLRFMDQFFAVCPGGPDPRPLGC